MTDADRTRTPARKRGGGVPPLVWILVALLLALGGWAWLRADGARRPAPGTPAAPTQAIDDTATADPATIPPPAQR